MINSFTEQEQRTPMLLSRLKQKVAQQVVRAVAAKGFHLPDERRKSILKSCNDYGDLVRRRMLLPVLGFEDNDLLNSASIYRQSNYRFASGIPATLSFGCDMGSIFYRTLCPGGRRWHKITALSALFNFGITIFDRVCDYSRLKGRVFNNEFDEHVLASLMEDPKCSRHFYRRAEDYVAELRIMMKVICCFFDRLHSFHVAQGNHNSADWKNLKETIMVAYLAQIQAGGGKLSTRSSFEISEKKSTLPFVIISQIALLGEHPRPAALGRLEYVVQNMANLFWKLDDLIDLSKDIVSNEVNSIVINAQQNREVRNLLADDLIIFLSEGDEIGRTVNGIFSCAAELFKVFGEYSGRIRGFSFKETVLAYVHAWSSAY